MMGPRQVEQGALFYEFSLDTHVPADHLLRSIDRFVDLTGRTHWPGTTGHTATATTGDPTTAGPTESGNPLGHLSEGLAAERCYGCDPFRATFCVVGLVHGSP